jgi:hypothetical protein
VQYTPGKETRKGLGPLLVGLLYALGEIVYGITEMTITHAKVSGSERGETFLFFFFHGFIYLFARIHTSSQSSKSYEEFVVVWTEETSAEEEEEEASTSEESPSSVGLSSLQLGKLFPFHVVFDENLDIQQWGPSMHKLAPGVAVGKRFTSVFNVTHPANAGTWTIDDAILWCGDLFISSFSL